MAGPGKILIRKAKPLDAVKIVRLLWQAYEEDGNLYPEPTEVLALNWVVGMLNEGHVIVAEKEGRLVGSVAVSNYRFPWSEKWYLYVDWLFVSKGFREGGVFEGLMKSVHDFADSQGDRGAPIFGGISSGKDARLKDRLLQMKGYHYLGGQFIRQEAGSNGRRVEENHADDDEQAERGD
jgi:predicted N-acetyltransferase YhbS